MFDSSFLTTELELYLATEANILNGVVDNSKINHLVEIGCGYGRYALWAAERRLRYDGIDLVSWMIDIGKLRLKKIRHLHPAFQGQVHHLPAANVLSLFEKQPSQERPLLFFPFNCFGNISDLKSTLENLRGFNGDLFISTFKVDEPTTEIRKIYYSRCGYTAVKHQTISEGTLVTSDEGLHASAYSSIYLISLLQKYGFANVSQREFANIGLGYHFVKAGHDQH